MADTVDLNEITEYFDSAEVVHDSCARLARWIGRAKHFTVFTGAGISAAASIPDFRGPSGVWTRKAQGLPPPKSIRMEQAIPTYAHMALAHLQQHGELKFLVSQNVDGLHLRSGVPDDSLAELHGNVFKETCWNADCERARRGRYLRTFDVSERVHGSGKCKTCKKRVPHFCHCTSRMCEHCGQNLRDSIIHFSENLPEDALAAAFDHAQRSDLCLVLGSSLRVTPACQVPETTKTAGGRLVIVNLQKTPYDDQADLVIHARIDEVMQLVMRALGMHEDVPPFHLSQAAIDEAARMGVDPPADAVRAVRARTAGAEPISVEIGNSAELVRESGSQKWYKWKIFVRQSAESAALAPDAIASVRFDLHETFDPPSVTIDGPGPFELQRTGWGTFGVKVRIVFRDDVHLAPMSVKHKLSFARDGSRRTYNVQASEPTSPASAESSTSASSDID